MAAKILPDVGLLRQIFDYDPETGVIRHRIRPRSMFQSDKAHRISNKKIVPGSVATYPVALGYLAVRVNGDFKAHRVAWKMHFGTEPPDVLDHINGDPRDNRIANLRPAFGAQNNGNCRIRRDNALGFKGVSQHSSGRFRARIRTDKRLRYLGMFDTPEEAHAAYMTAASAAWGEFANPGTKRSPR